MTLADVNSRIQQIQRETIPMLAALVHPEQFTQQQRQQQLLKAMTKGWPGIIADLEYLLANLPPNHPGREGYAQLLAAASSAAAGRNPVP